MNIGLFLFSKVVKLIPMVLLALVLWVFIVWGLTGCGGIQVAANPCDEVTDSLLCSKLKNPKLADVMLRFTSYKLVKDGVYSKAEVLEFLDGAESLIKSGTTYAGLVRHLSGRLKTIPPELVILSDGMITFKDVLVLITPSDAKFFLDHIALHRIALNLL